jgi:hypothetical protein
VVVLSNESLREQMKTSVISQRMAPLKASHETAIWPDSRAHASQYPYLRPRPGNYLMLSSVSNEP